MTKKFQCDCGGPTKVIDDEHVSHACRHKYAFATSFYDGIDRFVPFGRVQVNPMLTKGKIQYSWWIQ